VTEVAFEALLALARTVTFGLSLGLTFISMGAAMTTLNAQLGATPIAFDIAETIPFIIGFAMLYPSPYR